MPSKPKRPCPKPGCRGLWDGKVCPTCGHKKAKWGWKDDRERGTAKRRGYDRAWRAVRARKLAHDPLCEMCEANGLTQEAEQVHHIKPFNGRSDPLRLQRTNLMSVCRRCHERLTTEASNKGHINTPL